jgi:hypothetical protein
MSAENPLWEAPRIHGELLKLGFEVAQSSVANYMVKRYGPPYQGWRTFLRNHALNIAGMDLFVVPTIGFDLLYVLITGRIRKTGDWDWSVSAAGAGPVSVGSFEQRRHPSPTGAGQACRIWRLHLAPGPPSAQPPPARR